VAVEVTINDESKEKNGRWNHLVSYVLELYEEIKGSTYREKKLKEIRESVEAYHQQEKHTDDPWPGASNIILPLTTISIDNLEPRLVSGFVGKRPYIRFEMEAEGKQDELTEYLETWWDNELEDIVRIESRTGRMVHQLLKEGTIFPMPMYDIDEKPRRDFVMAGDEQDPEVLSHLISMGFITQGPDGQPIMNGTQEGGIYVDANGMPVTIDRKDIAFEGGKIEMIPFKDMFIPDDAEDWESTPVIYKTYPTYAQLQRRKDGPGYLADNIDEYLLKDEKNRKLAQDQQSETQSFEAAQITGKEVIECLVFSCSYIYQADDQEKEDITNFTEERLVGIIAIDQKVLLRLIPLRELNFKNEHLPKRIRLFPEENLAYGTSLYGKLKSIQKGASKTFNTAINIAELVMIPWFLYEERSGIQRTANAESGGKRVKLKLGEGIPVDSVQGVLFPSFSINPAQMIGFLEVWVSYWEKLVSIGDPQIGRVPEATGKNKTATAFLGAVQEGNIKHNYQAKTMIEEYLSVLRTLYDLYYQNMPFEKKFLFKGQMIPVPRAAMRRRHRFKLTGSTELANKLIERKEKEDLYGALMQNPVADPIKVTKELVKAYGFQDQDEWVNPQINQIVMAIKEIPGAADLFQQSIQQAQALAQGIEEQAKGESGGLPGANIQ